MSGQYVGTVFATSNTYESFWPIIMMNLIKLSRFICTDNSVVDAFFD